MMQFEVIIPLIAYLVVVFGLSLYAMRKRASGSFLNEYFLGSRSMGGFVLAMTLTATYISASSFIGGPGAAYKYGLGWVLLAMIQLPAIWLSLGVLGKKFAILARRYNAVTLNDMLFARYQEPPAGLAGQPESAGGLCRRHDRPVYRRRPPAGDGCRYSLRYRPA
ncbi:hypothetical protein LNQ52_11930 [Klebsiella pneumoniae subsp. pneumoniae]|nr:hypothetical protein [Klebsiella pneumoniae subsp. pneumoniae]